ncbi:MAG: FecR domain-containing protein [Rhodospirillales bacterium]|nr:FecR domain-containing protein [Rhodospirillales bacterium]
MNDKPEDCGQAVRKSDHSDQPDMGVIRDGQNSADVMDQAIAWQSRSGIDDPSSAVHAQFLEWCAQNPAHQAAANKLSTFIQDTRFDSLLSELEAELPDLDAATDLGKADDPLDQTAKADDRVTPRIHSPVSNPVKSQPHRLSDEGKITAGKTALRQNGRLRSAIGAVSSTRRFVAILCVMVAVVAIGVNITQQQKSDHYLAALSGVVIAENLPDGSQITLAPGTVLTWDMSGDERHISLQEGAVIISAAHDVKRPMVVHTAISDVTVVGTRFIVISDPSSNEIGVAEGIVRVRETKSNQHVEATLQAGQGLVVDQSGALQRSIVSESQIEKVIQGWRLFTTKSLGDVAAALRRQSGAKLWVDPSIADLAVRGRFNLADGDASITLLAQSLGLSRLDLPFGYVVLTNRL